MSALWALAGNQNCGKTTLFNRLTGANQRVGNWPGVTVERKEGTLSAPDEGVAVVDLPGAYALAPYSAEEAVTRDFLLSGQASVILNVVDATQLERSLYLTLELLALGRPLVVALNLMDEAARRGDCIDAPALSRALGVPVVPISARRGEGLDALRRAARRCPPPAPCPVAAEAEAEARYAWIERCLRGCLRRGGARRAERSERLDRVLLHRWLGLPLFALLVLGVFFAAFGPMGTALAEAFGALLDRGTAVMAGALLRWGAAPWARSLLIDGVCRGVGSVLSFLPTLLVLFFLLALLEDSGYMARAAFLMDAPLRRVGLNGRAFIPLLLGFGCTVPAVMSARSLGDERDRRLTVLLTPFMSCGAKAPLYALLARAFFSGRAAPVMGALYALGVLLAALAGGAYRRWALGGDAAPFWMELPDYRLPTPRGVARQVAERARDFVRRAFTVVFLATLGVWFLQRFTATLAPAATLAESLLGRLSGALAPLLRPAGFGDARAAAALLTGLLAKESVVSTLSVLANGSTPTLLGQLFPTPLAACSFLVFALLYSPCAAALAAIRRELGGARWALGVAVGQTLLAWLLATLLFQTGRLLGFG